MHFVRETEEIHLGIPYRFEALIVHTRDALAEPCEINHGQAGLPLIATHIRSKVGERTILEQYTKISTILLEGAQAFNQPY